MADPVTEATFRAKFPEFSSVAAYPSPVVTYWLEIANAMLPTNRWRTTTIRELGMMLFAAHNIAIEKAAINTASKGGVPGSMTGPINSKSVGPASIAYSTADAVDPAATHWNLTVYGTRLWQMIQMFGAGPIQVGIGCAPFGGWFTFLSAWPGPCPWPLPGGSGFSS